MATINQDSINFTNIQAVNMFPAAGKYTMWANVDSNGKFDTTLTGSEITKSLNAIEIDWNGAQLNLPEAFGGTQNISSTGQLLSLIKQLADKIDDIENNVPTPLSMSIDVVSTSNGVRTFSITSSESGALSLSTTAGQLSKTAFTMVANTSQNFTLSNRGADATEPVITISSDGSTGLNSRGIIFRSNVAGQLYIGVDGGAFSSGHGESQIASLTMVPNVDQSIQWVNSSSYTYTSNPRITAWQTANGSTNNSINYVITAIQNGESYAKTGILDGGTGVSKTSYSYFNIDMSNVTPATYYWYAGQTAPTSTITTTTSYENGGGWYELGTTIPDTINQLVKGGNNELNWYAAVPITNGSTLKPVASDMTTIDTSVTEYSTITISNVSYKVYYYGGFTAARNTFRFAKK